MCQALHSQTTQASHARGYLWIFENLRTYVMTPCVASFLARYWMSEQTSIFVVKSLCQGHWVQTLYHGDMPYNCYAGLANWRAGWSQPKKDTREAGREIGRIWESIPGGFPSSRRISRSIVCDRLFAVFYARSPASWILMHFDAFWCILIVDNSFKASPNSAEFPNDLVGIACSGLAWACLGKHMKSLLTLLLCILLLMLNLNGWHVIRCNILTLTVIKWSGTSRQCRSQNSNHFSLIPSKKASQFRSESHAFWTCH